MITDRQTPGEADQYPTAYDDAFANRRAKKS